MKRVIKGSLSDKERYGIYNDMFYKKIPKLKEEIEDNMKDYYGNISDVFISVADEEKGLYFVDFEVYGEEGEGKYRRFRGNYTLEQIKNKFCK